MNNPTHGTPPAVVGQRRVFYFNDAGQPAYRVYDLTAVDFLNAQPGDEFAHGEAHDRLLRRVGALLRYQHRFSPNVTVHLQPKLIWPDPTLDQPMPDMVLVNDLTEPLRHRPTLDLAAEGVTLRAVVEITSPLLADQDHTAKAALYAHAGVPEYWIIDPASGDAPPQLHGYLLEGASYRPIAPNAEGKLESRACRVWFQVIDGEVYLGDLRTGKPLPPPAEDDDPTLSAQAEAARRAQSIAGQLNL